MTERKSTMNPPIDAWVNNAFKKARELNWPVSRILDIYLLAARINQNKIANLEKFEKLGLPGYEKITLPLKDFLENPNSHFRTLGSTKFYLSLVPRDDNLNRLRQINAGRRKTLDFIGSNVAPGDIASYDLVLREFYKNVYTGNIAISPNGFEVKVEMVKGDHGPLVGGSVMPKYIVQRNPFTKRFEYPFEDPALREVVWNTISYIPHRGEGLSMLFEPGYYEVAWARREKGAPLEPFFFDYIDYVDRPAYSLP